MNIIIDLLDETKIVVPQDLEADCIILGKFPGWTSGNYELSLKRTQWLLDELGKYPIPESVVVFINDSIMQFGMALAIVKNLVVTPRIVVVTEWQTTDLSEFTNLKEVITNEEIETKSVSE